MQSTMHYPQNSKNSTIASSYGHGSPYRRGQYQYQGPFYTQTPPPSTENLGYNQAAINSLTQTLASTTLGNGAPIGGENQVKNPYAANGTNSGSMLAMHNNGQLYYQHLGDGTLVMPGMNSVSGTYQPYAGNYSMGFGQNSYLYQPAYNGFASSTQHGLANTLRNNTWEVSRQVPVEVPDLAAPRRTSQSSNEGPPSPHTPYNFGTYPSTAYRNVTSENPLDPWVEHSPIQLAEKFPFEQIWRTRNGGYEYVDYYAITRNNEHYPKIPIAVPARQTKDSGRGTFDKILDNEHGTTNVYIRGLWPDTTDDKLEAYGARFGDIVSCKAIIELQTGTCKGFGFLMYHNYTDAENCIRCFYYLGYEAKFAKLSHNERLKNCADPENNNLYVSNLPKVMTEKELKALFNGVFPDFVVTSTKVLKDEQGISRGVGFVRFETHDICEKVIDHFNKHPMPIGDDGALLQIRYADSPAQKKLKEESAAHRTFKANEYNMEAFGPGSPFEHLPVTPLYPSPLQSNGTRSSGSWRRQASASPGTFMTSQSLVGTNTSAAPMVKSQLHNVMPAYNSTTVGISAESPCPTATLKRTYYETNSIGGNTLVGSHNTDASSKDTTVKTEDSSNDEETVEDTLKIEPVPTHEAVDDQDKVDPSPSKANKAKL